MTSSFLNEMHDVISVNLCHPNCQLNPQLKEKVNSVPLQQLLYLNQFTLYIFLWLKEHSFVDIKLEENSLMTLVAILKETEYYDVNNNKES